MKKILFKKDEAFEKQVKEQIVNDLHSAEQAISEYKQHRNKFDFEDFADFCSNAVEKINKDFENSLTIPKGMAKDKYLSMAEYPDLTEIQSLISQIKFKNCIELIDEAVSINQSEAVTEYTKKHLFITKKQSEVLEKLKQFVELANELETELQTTICEAGVYETFQREIYPNGKLTYRDDNIYSMLGKVN